MGPLSLFQAGIVHLVNLSDSTVAIAERARKCVAQVSLA